MHPIDRPQRSRFGSTYSIPSFDGHALAVPTQMFTAVFRTRVTPIRCTGFTFNSNCLRPKGALFANARVSFANPHKNNHTLNPRSGEYIEDRKGLVHHSLYSNTLGMSPAHPIGFRRYLLIPNGSDLQRELLAFVLLPGDQKDQHSHSVPPDLGLLIRTGDIESSD